MPHCSNKGRKQNRSQVSIARRRQLASRLRLLTSQVFSTAYRGLENIGRDIGALGKGGHALNSITCPNSTWQCATLRVSTLGTILSNLWTYLTLRRLMSQQASGLRPLACWDLGFESHRGHGYLFVVSVVCCQVEVAATSWSLVQRSPADCAASLCVI